MITARDRLGLIGASLAFGLGANRAMATSSEASKNAGVPGAELPEAWAALCASLGKAAEIVQSHPYYESPENRASGFAMINAVLIGVLEKQVILDPDFPIFHAHDSRLLSGADNPDQRYLTARIRGAETYRIWGRIRNERRLDVQVYAGASTATAPGRSASFLRFEDLQLDKDGSFEITLSPERAGRNWIDNPHDGAQVMVRQVYSDWGSGAPGEVHIDRVGFEGALRPALDEATLAQRFRAAGERLLSEITTMGTLHRTMIDKPGVPTPVNEVAPPVDTFAQGGPKGRYISIWDFELSPNEALVLRIAPTGATYLGIRVGDLWNSSLEYANRQTSLTPEQCHIEQDGSCWIVLGGNDPGVQNWLDTMGRRRGRIEIRYDGIGDRPFDPANVPQMHKVKYDELKAKLPKGTPAFSQAQRFAAIAARRRHLQERCHH